jgi:molybdopterin-guanine dinucleotide biosynthesis protein A
MQGSDKLDADVGGHRILDRVISSCDRAARVIVVGPVREGVTAHVTWTREFPEGSGPVAAIAAGMQHVRRDVVVVLAGDLPFVTGAPDSLVQALAATDADAVVPVDAEGFLQGLCAAYRTDALRAALASINVVDASVHSVLDRLRLTHAPGLAAWAMQDVDTPEDLISARHRALTLEGP